MVRRSLLPLLGHRIEGVEIVRPSILSSKEEEVVQAAGRKVAGIDRRGKQIFIILEEGVLTLHLGMTGEVTIGERSQDKHVTARLRFADQEYLNFIDQRRFGALGYAHTVREFVASHHLGEDILQSVEEEFTAHVRRSRRPIKSILLDQSVTAGIGNLYADEALFQARVHPLRTGASLDEEDAARIWRMSRKVIRRSLSVGTDFSRLPKVYLLRDRAPGAQCPRCRTRLDSHVIAGRTSVFCPHCQKA